MGAAVHGAGVLQGREDISIPMFLSSRTRTSWVCCIPYSTKKKVKEATSALEKVFKTWRAGKGGTLNG